jgi:eukaryotic-like serine/threonine-protein kinase
MPSAGDRQSPAAPQGSRMSCLRKPDAEPIPGYRLIEPLGSGGFGEVWKCEAPGGLFKAIKFVYGNLNSLDVDGVRAEQELRSLQQVKEVRHPFVLSLDRIEIVEGELVIVMELADKSLHDAYLECQAAGLIGIPQYALLRYIRDAAEALDHMNEKHNLQHLDIKPRNLFLVSERVKVADFGLVKHLERHGGSGLMAGVTPLYASPETFNGQISDRSDQYSLAIVYQELLTGQRPFTGKSVRQIAQQHLQAEPELRALPEVERPVIARALAKDPAKRFPNCKAFIRALYNAQGWSRPEGGSTDQLAPKAPHARALAETMEDFHLDEPPQEPANGTTEHPAALAQEGGDNGVGEVSRLGMTVAQPESGALRPTILIGVGGFGRRALRELRCRFLDRLGDLSKVPLLRFLYVDPDPQAVQDAVRGTPEVAFSRNEVYHLPLQMTNHYRRRMLDHLTDWLPREKLHSIPRSLQTQGSRALGRLAFVDNHLRLLARLRREVQQATHPDTLYQSVSHTGLALRDSVPRVYVVAAAGGGGSGFVVDMGYALRRLLQQLRHTEAEVTLFLFSGAPSDPATPRGEQANVYATLTELNHFADPSIPFAAQYGADGPRIVDQGAAYTCTYLLQLPSRSPEALRDTVAHLGSYLFHELTTPLGLRLDRERQATPPGSATPFRSFGTYAVWFPRGLILRLAARQACRRLIEEWQAPGGPTPEVEAACARVLAESELRPEAIGGRLEDGARPALDSTPAEALTGMLAALEDQSQQSVAHEDPTNWTRQALTRVREWVRTGPPSISTESEGSVICGEWRKGRVSRALLGAAEKLVQEWEQRVAQVAFALMDNPGRRVAATEAALGQFVQFCDEAAAAQRSRWEQQSARTRQAWEQLDAALEGCQAEANGGWGITGLFGFGNRTRRQLRVYVDLLAAFARQCLAGEVIGAVQTFFVLLKGRLDERLRGLTFCRQRLRHLHENLDATLEEDVSLTASQLTAGLTGGPTPVASPESFWESIRQSATTRVVLPEGEVDLEQAAERFAGRLSSEQLAELDVALQARVLAPAGGLYAACAGNGDLVRGLSLPLLDQAAAYLGEHLPVTDVAQVELAEAEAGEEDPGMQVREWFVRAAPLVVGKDPSRQTALLLVPASEAGRVFGEQARQVVADLQVVRVPGQAHLMFCREQGYLSADDLQHVLRSCRPAYEEAVYVPQSSPHARFDITDWVPLDP